MLKITVHSESWFETKRTLEKHGLKLARYGLDYKREGEEYVGYVEAEVDEDVPLYVVAEIHSRIPAVDILEFVWGYKQEEEEEEKETDGKIRTVWQHHPPEAMRGWKRNEMV